MREASHENERLLFEREVLKARLEIRDFFLNSSVREIYENIGQVLSLVRLQLALADHQNHNSNGVFSSSGDLIEQTIRDLRKMSRSFYPDEDILQEDGFLSGLKQVIEVLKIHPVLAIKTRALLADLSPELKLYVFRILQEILTSIVEKDSKLTTLSIINSQNLVVFIIYYKAKGIQTEADREDRTDSYTLFQKKMELVRGSIHIRKSNNRNIRVTLSTPFNFLYE